MTPEELLDRVRQLALEWQKDAGRTWVASCGDELMSTLEQGS